MEERGGEVAGGRKGELGRISAPQRQTVATSQKEEDGGNEKLKRDAMRGRFIFRQRKVAGENGPRAPRKVGVPRGL